MCVCVYGRVDDAYRLFLHTASSHSPMSPFFCHLFCVFFVFWLIYERCLSLTDQPANENELLPAPTHASFNRTKLFFLLFFLFHLLLFVYELYVSGASVLVKQLTNNIYGDPEHFLLLYPSFPRPPLLLIFLLLLINYRNEIIRVIGARGQWSGLCVGVAHTFQSIIFSRLRLELHFFLSITRATRHRLHGGFVLILQPKWKWMTKMPPRSSHSLVQFRCTSTPLSSKPAKTARFFLNIYFLPDCVQRRCF